ncbi:MAG: GNAT family protein [Pseudomonadota bacterium]
MPDARPLGQFVKTPEARAPDGRTLVGRHVRLEQISPQHHGPKLWAALKGHDQVWDYLYEEVPKDEAAFIETLQVSTAKPGWLGYALCLPDGRVPGYMFYLNIVPAMGSIEVGNINLSPLMQRGTAATEAQYLMMQEAFRLGYRRYEWKCNALNAPSRRAAERLGFSFEGVFRQHLIVKGRNRDTAWFAITDQDWGHLQQAYARWLDDRNFDGSGRQQTALSDLTEPHLVQRDPTQCA